MPPISKIQKFAFNQRWNIFTQAEGGENCNQTKYRAYVAEHTVCVTPPPSEREGRVCLFVQWVYLSSGGCVYCVGVLIRLAQATPYQ